MRILLLLSPSRGRTHPLLPNRVWCGVVRCGVVLCGAIYYNIWLGIGGDTRRPLLMLPSLRRGAPDLPVGEFIQYRSHEAHLPNGLVAIAL